jgi:hypothetical protein
VGFAECAFGLGSAEMFDRTFETADELSKGMNSGVPDFLKQSCTRLRCSSSSRNPVVPGIEIRSCDCYVLAGNPALDGDDR